MEWWKKHTFWEQVTDSEYTLLLQRACYEESAKLLASETNEDWDILLSTLVGHLRDLLHQNTVACGHLHVCGQHDKTSAVLFLQRPHVLA